MTARYKAIMFDAGHTLLRVEPSVGEVYARTASDYGVNAVPAEIDTAFRTAWKESKKDDHVAFYGATSENDERRWWRTIVTRTFELAAPAAAFQPTFDVFFDDLYERFAHPEVWHVYDDVRPALKALQNAGIRLCVVSNWDSRLPRLLHALDLAHHFEFILTSAEVGWRKPHPAIFQCALENLALEPAQVAHVGDSHDEDVAGARNAGVRPIMLDRGSAAEFSIDRIQSLVSLSKKSVFTHIP